MRKHMIQILIMISLLVVVIVVVLIIYFISRDKTEYQSKHFHIYNYSSASYFELRKFARSLEVGRKNVYKFLKKEYEPDVTNVIVNEGRKIPSTSGGILRLYRHKNRIYSGLIPHELTHIIAGYKSSLVVSEGISVFTAESLAGDLRDRFPYYGQTTDAWTNLAIQKKSFIPLKDLLEVSSVQNMFNLDGSPSDAFAWQVYVEGGSFVRWIVEAKGWDIFWKYYDSSEPVPILGSSIEEIEKDWVQHIKNKNLSSVACRELLDQSKVRFKFWCDKLDNANM